MKLGLIMRRLAAAILVLFAGLCVAGLVPLMMGARVDDVVRHASSVLSYQPDSFSILTPVKLSSTPAVTLVSGSVFTSTASGLTSSAVVLDAPVFEIMLSDEAQPSLAAAALSRLAESVMAPIIDRVAHLNVEKATLRRGVMVLKWQPGRSLRITDVEMDVTVRNNAIVAAAGTFTYLGQQASIAIQSGPGVIGSAASAQTETLDQIRAGLEKTSTATVTTAAVVDFARWPLQLTMTSAALDLRLDGTFEIGTSNGWCLRGQSEVHARDAAALTAWLGSGKLRGGDRVRDSGGPAVVVKGPVRWSDGVISFGKSQISLSDQEGVGAVSISLREGRPLVEATVAFPALDAAPLLYRAASHAPLGETPTLLRAAAVTASSHIASVASAPALWRSLATSFPSILSFDIDLRVSAARLQWRGEPTGRGAVTATARAGKLHADFAELDLGTHRGSLQVTIDETETQPKVGLRGRFDTTDAATIATQIFGVAVVKGAVSSHFELAGQGYTLGEVVDVAVGRGSVEARQGGQMPIDLQALRTLSAIPAGTSPAVATSAGGWGSAAAMNTFESLDVKFQVRRGDIIVEQATMRGKGLVAMGQGRVGVSSLDLDLLVGLSPAIPARPVAQVKPSVVGTRVQGIESGDLVGIRGPWARPTITSERPKSLP